MNTWSEVVRDAALGQLKKIYHPATIAGKDVKPSVSLSCWEHSRRASMFGKAGTGKARTFEKQIDRPI